MKIVLASWLSLLAISVCVAACATLNASTTQYVGAPHYPPTEASSVEILRFEPRKPHERLGEIVIDASSNPAPAIEKVEDKMRSEAAKIGANAVVVVLDRLQPSASFVGRPWRGGGYESTEGRKVVGIAVRYR